VPVADTLNAAVWPMVTARFAGCVEIVGGISTVNMAALLVTLEALLLTFTVNCALLSDALVAGVVYEAAVAPLMATPFLLHWYVRGAEPVAVTENVAACPAATVLLTGCEVIAGATMAEVTVSDAVLLVRLELLSVTTTVNCAPLSELVVAGVKYDA